MSPEPRGDDGLGRPRRPTGNFADGLRSMRGLPRVVWVLGVASLLNDVSSEAIFPLLPVFLTSLGAPMRFLGLIEGSADALASLLKVAAGRLSDRGPRRLLVAGGYALPALARAGIAAALAPWHVLAARLRRSHRQGDPLGPARRDDRRFGAAHRSAGAPSASTVRWITSARRSGRCSPACCCRRAPACASSFSVAAVIGMMAPVVLFFRLREQPRRRSPIAAARSTRPAARVAAARLLRLPRRVRAVRARQLVGRVPAGPRARGRLVGQPALPLLWAFHHLVKSMAAVPGGTLSDRHSRGVVVSFGWAAYALTYVGFGVRERSAGRSSALFLVYALYHGLAEGAERAIIADLSERGARGRAYGLYHGLVGVAALPAGIGTGLVWDRWGPAWALGVNAAFAAVASAFLLALTFAGPLRRGPAPRSAVRRLAARLGAAGSAARGGCAAARAGRSAASRRPAPRRSRP